MARLAVFIHGMWATPDVWHNWRPFLEERGWRTLAPALRHHDAPTLDPPPALGTTSLLDYASDLEAELRSLPEKPVVIGHSMGGLLALMLCARGLATAGVLLTPAPPAGVLALRPSNVLAFARIETRWGWWRKPHRATLREALSHTFNTTDPREGSECHAGFVHDSGRALLELGLPWLARPRAADIDPRLVTVPLLFVAAEQDRLVPPDVVQRTARRFGHASDFLRYPGGHWVLGQPGWERIAGDTVAWLEGKAT
ncbi:alpha/beta hydrolase [Reyranella sp.]|uniref:alpha/beta hydrolase n=1 Tax=Reyranella sp. TaxID=1929291 RepID=UPI003BAB2197